MVTLVLALASVVALLVWLHAARGPYFCPICGGTRLDERGRHTCQ